MAGVKRYSRNETQMLLIYKNIAGQMTKNFRFVYIF